MKSRNLVRFFLSTLSVGAVITVFVGFTLNWGEYKDLFIQGEIGEIVAIAIWLIGVGCIFSLISQMGFFSYLTVHRFGLSIFKSSSLWNSVQVVLILFVLFDFVYFRYTFFAEAGESIMNYLFLALTLLVVGVAFSYVKMKQTNRTAFIPALFFLTVVTIVEWFPALRTNEESWLYLMLIPLLICNIYQLLMLPKFLKSPYIMKEVRESK
ncbi:KinB-signaling pathway activation protein [Priestia filamentosa]|uniref:KinB-signaling pathway activation protein n=1 Tax=Priestia filamentosa TaxID=1402861 RepID=UPI002349EA13|nr:KinB-signaling pathway activation protein [Priestia filamentosa]WCM15999.1 KinB-signaling pathway activation protein [Priestia filamentosa]